MATRNAYASPSRDHADRAILPRLAWDRLRLMLRTAATRRRLARLDERALKDIGLNRAQALEEAGRMPWDVGPCRRPFP
jgi:uncharacterized protein YjiS (DUF1127 family)